MRLEDPKSYRIHKKRHFEPQEVYPCPDCGRELSSKYILASHVRRVHGGERNYGCEICGAMLKSPAALRHHHMAKHTDVRPFNCEFCSNTFKTAQCARLHTTRMHHDMGEVQCEICLKWCRNPVALSDHSKIHENVTFVCPKCDLMFPTKKQMLAHHLSAHFRYKCLVCEHTLSRRDKIVKHINEKHPEVLANGCREENYLEKYENP